MDTLVVVGGGLAAAKAVEELRSGGYAGRVVLIAREEHLPYERPPLSKGYLMGNDDREKVFVHPRSWYDEHEVDLRLGTRATALDIGGHVVTTDAGPVAYDRLLLATGAGPRRLAMADDSGAPTAYLRTVDDSDRLRDAFGQGRRLAVIGGGWIGLEAAAAAREAGCEVTVLEALELPLVRVLGREVAEVFRDLHAEHGVDLRTSVEVTAVSRDDAGRAAVSLADGPAVTADLLLVGIGAAPSVELAESAGLLVDNGVVVDDHLRASDPDVFAAGYVANAHHPLLGRHVRVEHWDNAIEQGRTAARNMMGGDESYNRLPYFFADQYDLGMEYVGHIGPEGYDGVVLRGDVPGRRFAAFWLSGGRVLAGMHVNDWDAIDALRAIVSAGVVDLDRLADPAVPLRAVVG